MRYSAFSSQSRGSEEKEWEHQDILRHGHKWAARVDYGLFFGWKLQFWWFLELQTKAIFWFLFPSMSFTLLLILKALQNSIFFEIFLLQFSKKSDKVENQFFSKQLEMFRFCNNKNTRVEPVLYLVDWWHLKKTPIMQERIEGELLLFHSV